MLVPMVIESRAVASAPMNLLAPPARANHLPWRHHRRQRGEPGDRPAALPRRRGPGTRYKPVYQLTGGVITSGLAIYDTMQYVRAPVSTICIGMAPAWRPCCSPPEPGKRFALPHSRIMIHQGSGGFRGNTPDVFIQVKEMETLVNTNHEILSHHTGQPIEKIVADTLGLLHVATEAKDTA